MLKAARAAKRGCELAPASPPEGLEIATVAGAAAGWPCSCTGCMQNHQTCWKSDYKMGTQLLAGLRATHRQKSCQPTRHACRTHPATTPLLASPGGCFWGLELAYQRLPGVAKTSVGYTAGQVRGRRLGG